MKTGASLHMGILESEDLSEGNSWIIYIYLFMLNQFF
jgi:hypothetical protein